MTVASDKVVQFREKHLDRMARLDALVRPLLGISPRIASPFADEAVTQTIAALYRAFAGIEEPAAFDSRPQVTPSHGAQCGDTP